MSGDPWCPAHGFAPCRCTQAQREAFEAASPRPRFYGDDRMTFGLRIEGTEQVLTDRGCSVCDDIPGLTDHGNGD